MEKIAFLGLGTMGANIARNLLNRGYPLTVHNQTVERARELQRAGAKVASTPKEAAASVDVIMMKKRAGAWLLRMSIKTAWAGMYTIEHISSVTVHLGRR